MEDGSCRLPMVRGLIAEEEEEGEGERVGLVVVARCRRPSRWSIALLLSLVTIDTSSIVQVAGALFCSCLSLLSILVVQFEVYRAQPGQWRSQIEDLQNKKMGFGVVSDLQY